MKKTLGAIACAVTLICGAAQAEATTLENPAITTWEYTLNSLTFQDAKAGTIMGSGESYSFTGSAYTHDFKNPGTAAVEGTLNLGGSAGGSALTETTATNTNSDVAVAYELVTLAFDYSATAMYNGVLQTLSKTSYITLNYYYDGFGTEYIYYSSVLGENKSRGTDGTFAYSLGDIEIHVDGKPLEGVPADESSPLYKPGTPDATYYGWLINEDTREKNPDGSAKTLGFFDIEAYFGITATKADTEPAPTPEPATMLLMGLGLAGLGVVARRRNRK